MLPGERAGMPERANWLCYSFQAAKAVAAGWLTKPFVAMIDPGFPALVNEERYIDSYRDGVVDHRRRNELIVRIAEGAVNKLNAPTLILVDWVSHGKYLRQLLKEMGHEAVQ